MKDFNVDKMIQDLEEFNKIHDKELNPTQSERELIELKQAVAEYKEWKAAKNTNNMVKRMNAVKKSNNLAVDKYIAMCNKKSEEWKENYF